MRRRRAASRRREGGRGGRGGNGARRGGAAAPRRRPSPCASISTRSQQRIVALPLPARSYLGLEPAGAGMVFVLEPAAGGGGGRGGAGGGGATLSRFDLKTRKSEKLADGVASFDLSANGDKMLLRMGGAGGAAAGALPEQPPAAPSYVIVLPPLP